MRYGLLWVFVLMYWGGFSQTIKVTNQQTSTPLEGVNISSTTVGKSIDTDAEGQAQISVFKGSEDILLRLPGFKSLSLSYNQIQSTQFKVEMTPINFNLDEIVVSGTRWQQSSRDIASKIISISKTDITLQNPQTAADLLGTSGKVFIQKSQQGGGSPMIRGFAANRLVYTVDGVRMNTAIFRGGNLQNVINLDPFAIDQTEVVFGPGSVIYGSDAIGGVMSFQTLRPRFSTTEQPLITGHGNLRYSSANTEQTGHADVNIGWNKWALVTSLSSWDYGHLKQGRHGPDDYIKSRYVQRQNGVDIRVEQDDERLQIPSAYSQMNVMQKVRFQPDENWDFEYGFHFSKTSTYGRYDRHNRLKDGIPRYAEWNYGPQQWRMHHMKISQDKPNRFYNQMSLRLAQQSFEESRIDRDFNSPERRIRAEQVDAYSANLDFIKTLKKNQSIYYGIEYVINDVTSDGIQRNITSGIISDVADRYPKAKWSSMAAYMNSEWKITDHLNLQGGMRYNQFRLNADFSDNLAFFPLGFTKTEINKSSLTGSLGLVYQPTADWNIRTNLGTAFRSPNVDDIGKVFDSEPGSVVVPQSDLDAEYAYNVDIGITKVFDDKLQLNLTGYYTHLDQAIVRRNFELNGREFIEYDGELSRVQALQNAAKDHIYGLQFGLEARLGYRFKLFTDLNYQKGEEELDDGSLSPSRHAAPFFGVSRLRYELKDELTLELNAKYQGEQSHEQLAISERSKDEIYAKDAYGNTYAPAWYTLNLKALYHLNSYIMLSGGLENLTDKRYRPYSSGLSGPGRNLIIALNFSF